LGRGITHSPEEYDGGDGRVCGLPVACYKYSTSF
jgi:hypothetical protein